MARHAILAVLGVFLTAAAPAAGVLETWEASPLQTVFNGSADLAWTGDLDAFAIEPGDWPAGTTIFGSADTKAVRSTNASQTVSGRYTLLTDIAAAVDPALQIEWSVYASGDSIAIQSGYWFEMILLANTADAATVESPDAAFRGYKLTISSRTVDGVGSDYLTLWRHGGDGWAALAQSDLGSAWMNAGWNLAVTRSPLGLWTVSHSTGVKGAAVSVDFTTTDTSVDLTGSSWWAGMTWATKGTYHAPKFGFDEFAVEAVEPPNLSPTADAGDDRTIVDLDADGVETVTLDGTASTDADGAIVSYAWTCGDQTAAGAAAEMILPVGPHTITLTVTDDDGSADSDTAAIAVMPGGPWPPTADAGDDRTIRDSDGDGEEIVALDGTGSTDWGGAVVAYLWKENGAVIAAGVTPEATLAVGVHTLTLEVTDSEGLTDADTVEIRITAVGPTIGQISQHGITWTFSQPVEYGRFVNGDYWVVGPVTIESISPAPSGGANGSMLNPSIGDGQAYDTASDGYNADAAVAAPITLTGDNSLVSVSCWDDGAESHLDYTGHTITASRCNLRDAAVLTVLNDVPPADAFRPAYAGTDKRIFRQADIRYDLLPRLAPPNTEPGYDYEDAGILTRSPALTVAAQYGRLYDRPWLLHLTDWSGRQIHPTENMPGYHREVYNCVAVGAGLLLMDLPDIDNLLIPYLQLGIDSYGVIATGAGDDSSDADSAINKWPVLLAGILLDDEAMKTNNYRYRTRWMTYYIVDGTSPYASAVVPAGQTYNSYAVGWRQDPGTQEHEHLDPDTEWDLVSDGGGSKRESYRRINSHTWPGIALAARLMNATDLWNDPAFFDYIDRWMTEIDPQPATSPASGSTSSAFITALWNTYRDSADALCGDVDHSGDLGAADIDMLAAAVRRGLLDPKFDLTDDSAVDAADIDALVREHLATQYGDADLDGAVDIGDFVILKNHFGDQTGWAGGDFSGDGSVSIDDFVILKNHFGFTAAP